MKKTIQHNTCAAAIAEINLSLGKGNLNEAFALIEQLEKDKRYPSSDSDEMRVTLLKGVILLRRGVYREAETVLLRSLDLANQAGSPRLQYNRYDNLVSLYTSTNQVHKAIAYLKRSMDLKEATGDHTALARSLLQMSSLLFSIEDFDDGKDAVDKAYEIISGQDNIEMKMQCHFAYGTLHVKAQKYPEALHHYDQIISYARAVNDVFLASKAYFNQGDILMKTEQWQMASVVYNELLMLARDNHLISQELLTCIQLAHIALRQHDIKRCRELYDYVNDHPELGEDDGLRQDLAEVGAELFDAEGAPQKALKAYRSYMHNYKRHYDNEQNKVILYIKARYESEKKERELKEIKLRQVESEMKVLIAEKQLRATEKRFKAWVENGTDMIVILRQDFSPIYTSPFVFRTFGYTSEDFRLTDPYTFIHPDDISSVMDTLSVISRNPGTAINNQFRFLEKAGSYRWLECTSTNLLHDETVSGIVCNLKDITERKQSEEAIQEMNRSLELKITERTQELQEAIKDLEAFSYSVSHDLRSPLRIITGYARLLITDHEHYFNEEAKEFVNTILDNSKRMGQLIDDLLNFSRLGRKAVYKGEVNMNAIVISILSDLRRADDTITTNITIGDLAPAFCDHSLINQVWLNLITNAIKYSSKKRDPVIEIGSMVQDSETVYYIKDNGAGFDMKFAKNLFAVFKRLHDRADFEGLGVGLALTHRIIRMHEGRIWAEAEVNEGATFYFTLGNTERTEESINPSL